MRIQVRRTAALGDVVLTTPVIRRIRREYPEAKITVHTVYPDVFRGNPHVNVVELNPLDDFDLTINLDLAYERRPSMHIVEAYMLEAFGDLGHPADHQQELFTPKKNVFLSGTKPYVAVHASQAGWRNRTLPAATWRQVCYLLHKANLFPILVGTHRDTLHGAQAAVFHAADLHAQARLIGSTACFVGSDSGLLHVAGTTDVPIVGVFTCARPQYRLPWRGGILGRDCLVIQPKLDCVGCLERQPVPSTVESCTRVEDPIACVRAVTAEEIVEAVLVFTGRQR